MAMSRRFYELMCKTTTRFHMCNVWVPYFWNAVLDDDMTPTLCANGVEAYVFTVDANDVKLFPELSVGQLIIITADEDYVTELEPDLFGLHSTTEMNQGA